MNDYIVAGLLVAAGLIAISYFELQHRIRCIVLYQCQDGMICCVDITITQGDDNPWLNLSAIEQWIEKEKGQPSVKIMSMRVTSVWKVRRS
jgi:hypothetical protein